MTKLQKKILDCLFRGGHIIEQVPGRNSPGQMAMFEVPVQPGKVPGKWSVREKDFRLVARPTHKKVEPLFSFCRTIKIGKTPAYVINKKMILSLHGNTWMKKRYKQIRDNKVPCEKTTLQIITSPYKN